MCISNFSERESVTNLTTELPTKQHSVLFETTDQQEADVTSVLSHNNMLKNSTISTMNETSKGEYGLKSSFWDKSMIISFRDFRNDQKYRHRGDSIQREEI